MLIPIDRNAPEPIYRQIIDGAKRLIDNGSLRVNDSLPSTRRLADRLGINRSTVVHAYEELQAQGYLSSRPGSYNRVLKRRREVPYREDRKSLISWEEARSRPMGFSSTM